MGEKHESWKNLENENDIYRREEDNMLGKKCTNSIEGMDGIDGVLDKKRNGQRKRRKLKKTKKTEGTCTQR